MRALTGRAQLGWVVSAEAFADGEVEACPSWRRQSPDSVAATIPAHEQVGWENSGRGGVSPSVPMWPPKHRDEGKRVRTEAASHSQGGSALLGGAELLPEWRLALSPATCW